uniref:Uncharacterized protein n=1 Tax=Arundo donax TaxID=35708 RepID=A0A0A8ZRD2_ARUDO
MLPLRIKRISYSMPNNQSVITRLDKRKGMKPKH